MKRTVALILLFAVCLSLCACSDTSSSKKSYADVKRELIGTWEGDIDASFYSGEYDAEDFYTWAAFIFKSDGSVRVHAQLCHNDIGTVDTKEYLGTYQINDSKITLNYTSTRRIVDSVVRDEASYSGSDTLQYTFENGKLSVYISGIELEKDQ